MKQGLFSFIRRALMGVANGVATLDGGGKVPVSELPLSVTGAVFFKGTWNATTNNPALSNSGGGGVQGDYYIVATAGATSIDGITDWQIGDWIINNGSVWGKIDNTEVTLFGTEYDSLAVDVESSVTGDTAFHQKLKLTTASLPAADYRITWYCELSSTSTAQAVKAQVQIDDTDTIGEMAHKIDVTQANGGYHTFSGSEDVTLTAATHDIDIDFGGRSAVPTFYIKNARVAIWRIA